MKNTSYFWVAAACFVGVWMALWTNSLFTNRKVDRQDAPTDLHFAQPADYEVPTVNGVDFRQAAANVLPSVVSVDRFDRRYDIFGDDTGRIEESGTGSGVVLSSDGVIVTNNHVVADAAKVRVRLYDKRSYEAKVLGTDSISDLAVLKIKADGLKPVELGDSSKVQVGLWSMAVGNPLGYDGTVSVGVISSLGRSLEAGGGESVLVGAIQTDAAINRGNSGGALTDATGRLIGINSAIATPSGGSVGIGFAIPVNRVKRVAQDIVKLGYARYGGTGVQLRQDLPPLSDAGFRADAAEQLGATPPDYGMFVANVDPSGPAAGAGVRSNDIIESVNGVKIDDYLSWYRVSTDKMPGDKVTLVVWERGKTKNLTIVLEEMRSH